MEANGFGGGATPDAYRIRVLVVDDHPIVRMGLRALLAANPDIDVVGEAADGPGALAAYAAYSPDVTVLDLRLPGMSGLEVLRTIRASDPEARVIIFTAYDTDVELGLAVQAGACGLLLKGACSSGILETAIRKVHAGGRVLSPQLEALSARAGPRPVLGRREVEILELVARGLSNKEIGSALAISDMTVKYHLKHIYPKLGVGDRTEAVVLAGRLGLIRAR